MIGLKAHNAQIPESKLKEWNQLGVKEFGDLYGQRTLRSFDDLRNDYKIHGRVFLIYGMLQQPYERYGEGKDKNR